MRAATSVVVGVDDWSLEAVIPLAAAAGESVRRAARLATLASIAFSTNDDTTDGISGTASGTDGRFQHAGLPRRWVRV